MEYELLFRTGRIKQPTQIVPETIIVEKDMGTRQKYELTEKDVNYVMEKLISFHNMYFPDVDIREVLVKDYVWNIPKEVIQRSRAIDRGQYDDIYDPLIFFYATMMEYDFDSYDSYIKIIRDRILHLK